MTNEEKQDLAALLTGIQEAKNSCFEMCKTIHRADDHIMKTMGYRQKTKAEAMQHTFEYYNEKIEKLQKAHVRKYPD